MTLSKDDVRGVIPPMATPFNEQDQIDTEALRREVRYLLEAGVHGLVIGGSTGEGACMSGEEIAELSRVAVSEVRGRVLVLAGVIADYTLDAVRRGLAAKAAGVDGLMVTPTHYVVPSPEGHVEYFTRITREVGLPIIIYNVVPRAPVRPDVARRLVEIPGVIGIKESIGGNLETLTELLATIGDRASVTFAIDPMLVHGFVLGAHGTISGISTMVPYLILELWNAVQRGDLAEARRLHYRLAPINTAFRPGNENWPSYIKAFINEQGRNVGKARSPMVPLSAAEREKVRAALVHAGVL